MNLCRNRLISCERIYRDLYFPEAEVREICNGALITYIQKSIIAWIDKLGRVEIHLLKVTRNRNSQRQ